MKNEPKKYTINMPKLNTIFMFIIFLFLYSSTAYAHKVYLFAWAEGDMIHTESYFSGNKKVRDGTIKVYNTEGKELVTGKTDENGEFSFKIPEIADLRIVLESSMGHGAEYLFKKSEFSPDSTASAETLSNTDISQEPRTRITIGKDQLQKEIETALESKLKPVIRELAKLREDKGPGVTEILGGIGYILGIMGIVAYMKSRRK